MEKKLVNEITNEYEITLEENEALHFYPSQLNPRFASAIAYAHSCDKVSVVYHENSNDICYCILNGVCLFKVDYKLVVK